MLLITTAPSLWRDRALMLRYMAVFSAAGSSQLFFCRRKGYMFPARRKMHRLHKTELRIPAIRYAEKLPSVTRMVICTAVRKMPAAIQ